MKRNEELVYGVKSKMGTLTKTINNIKKRDHEHRNSTRVAWNNFHIVIKDIKKQIKKDFDEMENLRNQINELKFLSNNSAPDDDILRAIDVLTTSMDIANENIDRITRNFSSKFVKNEKILQEWIYAIFPVCDSAKLAYYRTLPMVNQNFLGYK